MLVTIVAFDSETLKMQEAFDSMAERISRQLLQVNQKFAAPFSLLPSGGQATIHSQLLHPRRKLPLPLLAVPETTLNCRRQVVASDQLAVAQAAVSPMPWPVDSFNLGVAWRGVAWLGFGCCCPGFGPQNKPCRT